MSKTKAEPKNRPQGEPSPNLRQQRWEIVVNIAGLVAVGIVTLALSYTLAKLSGTALRLPPPWGASVQAVMVALGVAVFAYCRHRNAIVQARCIRRAVESVRGKGRKPKNLEELEQDAKQQMEMVCKVRSRRVALGMLIGVVVLVFLYQGMHNRCQWEISVPVAADDSGQINWWVREFHPTPELWHRCEEEKTHDEREQCRDNMLREADKHLPRFLVRERRPSVYLPLSPPEDFRRPIIASVDPLRYDGIWNTLSEDEKFHKGMTELSVNDPNRLIEFVKESMDFDSHMERTQLWFYIVHAVVIILVGAAAGVVFAPEQAIRRLLEQMASGEAVAEVPGIAS